MAGSFRLCALIGNPYAVRPRSTLTVRKSKKIIWRFDAKIGEEKLAEKSGKGTGKNSKSSTSKGKQKPSMRPMYKWSIGIAIVLFVILVVVYVALQPQVEHRFDSYVVHSGGVSQIMSAPSGQFLGEFYGVDVYSSEHCHGQNAGLVDVFGNTQYYCVGTEILDIEWSGHVTFIDATVDPSGAVTGTFTIEWVHDYPATPTP